MNDLGRSIQKSLISAEIHTVEVVIEMARIYSINSRDPVFFGKLVEFRTKLEADLVEVTDATSR